MIGVAEDIIWWGEYIKNPKSQVLKSQTKFKAQRPKRKNKQVLDLIFALCFLLGFSVLVFLYIRCILVHLMNTTPPSRNKIFDFECRSRKFARDVRFFVEKVPYTISNKEYNKQLIRSSGSVGANYIEADEALSKKDCIKHMRIARKEAKESIHWLDLMDVGVNNDLLNEQSRLINESKELICILSAMIINLTQ